MPPGRARRTTQWVTVCITIGGLLALVPYLHHRLPPAEVVPIDEARFSFERAGASARARTLPDDWLVSDTSGTEGWYRMHAELDSAPQRPWAVYLPTASAVAAVYVNGHLVGDGGVEAELAPRRGNRPVLFTVPRDRLAAGSNAIDVHLRADPAGSGYLSALYLGPASLLAPIHELRTRIKVGAVWAITMGLAVLGVFMALLWLARPRETLYGWFALVTLLWAGHNLNTLVVHMPVVGWLWDWLTRFGALQWFAVIGVIFVNRFLSEPQPRAERALLWGAFAVTGVFAVLPKEHFYSLGPMLWVPAMLLIGMYAAYRLSRACRARPTQEALGLLASALVVVAFGVRDALLVNALWDRAHGKYLQYAAPVLLVVFAWFLVERFVGALNASETLNAELESRVERARRALEDNYERLRRLERERILTQERERIMRDMHDGMGGHLVSTLALIDRGRVELREVADCLRAALVDLRLMIDSMDVSSGDVPAMLGSIREGLRPRLVASGIDVRWEVAALSSASAFGPQDALQVMRIVQEAITNVLKHAGATTLTVRAREVESAEGARIRVEIADDGAGFAACARERSGRGLDNMRRRAASIGAELTIRSDATGTTVSIDLPRGSGSSQGPGYHRAA